MNKRLMIITLFILLISISLCEDREADINSKSMTEEIKQIASEVNSTLVTMRKKSKELGEYAEYIYKNSDEYEISLEGFETEYAFFDNIVLYKPEDDGGSAYFYSGYQPVGVNEKEKVRLLENFEPKLKSIQEEYPSYIVQTYINTYDSLNIIYPYFDVIPQYAPNINIPDYNFYYEADQEHNPSREPVWVEEPYIDPAGKGWMVSIISPIYNGDFLEGVVGLDITISTLNKIFLKGSGKKLMIVDDESLPIAINKECADALQLKQLKEHNYLESIMMDKFRSEDIKLSNNESAGIRELARRLNDEIDFHIEIDETMFHILIASIPELDWKLVYIE
jgi:hypothetical protein